MNNERKNNLFSAVIIVFSLCLILKIDLTQCEIVSAFESVDEILQCGHSNKSSSAELSDDFAWFLSVLKTKFGIFLEFLFSVPLEGEQLAVYRVSSSYFFLFDFFLFDGQKLINRSCFLLRDIDRCNMRNHKPE